MKTSLPHNLDAEMAVLGAVLLAGSAVLEPLIVEVGLRAPHFFREQHSTVFGAMVELYDRDAEIDWLTVAAHLDEQQQLESVGGRVMIDALAGCAPAAGNATQYARIVVRLAMWRGRERSALGMLAAVAELDEAAWGTAEASISTADRPEDTSSTAEQLADEALAYLEGRGGGDAIELPFPELNRLLFGGLRPGDVTLVSGWTSAGKTCLAAGILEHAAANGAAAHLYSNEMSRLDTTLRAVASLSGIPFGRLLARKLDAADAAKVMAALQRFINLNVGITDCSGWSAQDIARSIRRHKWDIAAIDLVSQIPARGTEEIDLISSTINTAARQSGCHIIAVVQLNQARNVGARLPRPVRRDIRGSGALANDAANVLMLHREQAELKTPDGRATGVWEMLNEGSVYWEKCRNGQLGGVAVTFDPRRMRYLETPRDAVAA